MFEYSECFLVDIVGYFFVCNVAIINLVVLDVFILYYAIRCEHITHGKDNVIHVCLGEVGL